MESTSGYDGVNGTFTPSLQVKKGEWKKQAGRLWTRTGEYIPVIRKLANVAKRGLRWAQKVGNLSKKTFTCLGKAHGGLAIGGIIGVPEMLKSVVQAVQTAGNHASIGEWNFAAFSLFGAAVEAGDGLDTTKGALTGLNFFKEVPFLPLLAPIGLPLDFFLIGGGTLLRSRSIHHTRQIQRDLSAFQSCTKGEKKAAVDAFYSLLEEALGISPDERAAITVQSDLVAAGDLEKKKQVITEEFTRCFKKQFNRLKYRTDSDVAQLFQKLYLAHLEGNSLSEEDLDSIQELVNTVKKRLSRKIGEKAAGITAALLSLTAIVLGLSGVGGLVGLTLLTTASLIHLARAAYALWFKEYHVALKPHETKLSVEIMEKSVVMQRLVQQATKLHFSV